MRHGVKWLLLAAICGATLFIPFRFENDALFYILLMDAAHLPGFFALTMFTHRFWPWASPPCARRLRAASAVALFSIAVEIIQPLTGRSSSLTDLINGIAGTLLAFILLASTDSARRTSIRIALIPLSAACLVAAFLPAWRESAGMRWRAANFPLLADFEADAELRLWPEIGEGTTATRSAAHASHGQFSLRVSTTPSATWPGVRLIAGGRDWSAYGTLAFDVWNDGPAFVLTMRVDDDFPHQQREDRFYRDLPLANGWNRFRLPLSEIESSPRARKLNLRAIRTVAFFIDTPKAAHTFHIDHVRLE
jgi:VanZ family protein